MNAVLPGLVPTEVSMKALQLTEEDLPAFAKEMKVPAERLGTPEDLGNAMLYFVSPASDWVTGECISISGGANLAGSI